MQTLYRNHIAPSYIALTQVYKLMSGSGQAEMGTVMKLFHALGYDLTVTQRKP